MPLHLLSKKSWNVYAPANIERVKRDEAEARRQAIEQEKRSLQNEADDRLEHLKQHSTRDRKSLKRKLAGEDDTDRDIRLAAEGTNPASTGAEQDHGLALDAKGHISLIPTPPQKKSRAEEQDKDPYTVYLTDATGRDRNSKPTWYTSLEAEREKWGDDNPRRQQRELARLNADDPLAAMKKGVKALRENEKARKDWMAQRERDLEEVERLARRDRHDKKHKRRRVQEEDDLASLEDFNLEDGYTKTIASRDNRDSEHEELYSHQSRHHGRSHRHRHESHSTHRARDHHNRHRRYEEVQGKRLSQGQGG
ncbi:hypothetical protein CLCR_02564 [Cladophialophora carrionii]|uniref:CBF1-interacting co-repressor CIR N-terminal domain-containing protein n=1 Tax=Cladophialophora carrionii TaxID=86049 RepID=A0A1C1CF60_9EURO|nr:hypothetical protein CLCR_02564 [Cladophialophora carrionii]